MYTSRGSLSPANPDLIISLHAIHVYTHTHTAKSRHEKIAFVHQISDPTWHIMVEVFRFLIQSQSPIWLGQIYLSIFNRRTVEINKKRGTDGSRAWSEKPALGEVKESKFDQIDRLSREGVHGVVSDCSKEKYHSWINIEEKERKHLILSYEKFTYWSNSINLLQQQIKWKKV